MAADTFQYILIGLNQGSNSKNNFVYQKAFIRTIHTSFMSPNILSEFTALEQKFKGWFCTQKPVLHVRLKDFWYIKVKYDEFNHEFLTFDNR